MTIMGNPPGLMQDGSKWEQAMQANRERRASDSEDAVARFAAGVLIDHVKQRARTAEAQQQIEDARAEPTVAEREAQWDDAQWQAAQRNRALRESVFPIDLGCGHSIWVQGCEACAAWAVKNGVAFARHMAGRRGIALDAMEDRLAPDTLTLSGARLAAYRQLEAAASAAAAAQQAMTTTGVALRDAIQAMCAAMTGVK